MITLVLCDIESRIHVDVQRHSKFREAVPVSMDFQVAIVGYYSLLCWWVRDHFICHLR